MSVYFFAARRGVDRSAAAGVVFLVTPRGEAMPARFFPDGVLTCVTCVRDGSATQRAAQRA